MDVLLGLSGGGDSVALFHALVELKRQKAVRSLRAAHVNHGWRGAASDADEKFCRELAKTHGVQLVVHKAPKHTPKTEEAARNVRRSFLKKIRRRSEWIALAHTADDQAETVLWRICRGAGLDGLSGLLPVEAPIVRPLLDVSRETLREALKKSGIPWREDETNLAADRTRTFIRNRLLPELEQVHPAARRHLTELAARHAEWNQWAVARARSELKARAGKNDSLDVSDWGLGPLVGRELLARWWRNSGLPDSGLTDSRLRELESLVLEEAPGPVSAPGGREVARVRGRLVARKAK